MLNTETRYVGKVCAKHPEESGQRYRADSRCVACAREKRMRQYFGAEAEKRTPEWKAARREYQREYEKRRYAEDPDFRAKLQARARKRIPRSVIQRQIHGRV